MYTAGFLGVYPFDSALYFGYNSLFTSNPTTAADPANACASTSTTAAAANYVYLCVPLYDTWSQAIESAACLSAPGDPSSGSTSNIIAGTCQGASGTCPATLSACSAVSAGFEAENIFGQAVYTIPVYSPSLQFAYLSNWSRVINSPGAGLPNFFTWLNAYSASPAVLGTVRQGFSQPTFSLNPYSAATAQDLYVLNNIYDTIYKTNPLNGNQIIDWMTSSHSILANNQLGYTPPSGTTITVRNLLRNDIFWHDGQKVTASDVAFSYVSLTVCSFCQQTFQAILNPLISVTVVSSTEFDLNLRNMGPFILVLLGSVAIVPGHIWYSPQNFCPSSWAAVLSTPQPVTYLANTISCLVNHLSGSIDPVSSGLLVGSGPWVCMNSNPPSGTASAIIGGGCSSDGTQHPAPGGSFTLTRYGCYVVNPSGTIITLCKSTFNALSSQFYFRSSSRFAQYIWTSMNGNQAHDVLNVISVASCATAAFNPNPSCLRWEQGIGNPTGDGVSCCGLLSGGALPLVRIAVDYLLDWTSPFAFPPSPTVLTGIATVPPVLYEGSLILNPAPATGHPCTTAGSTFNNGAGYDC
jgi:hypothetical protein